MHSKAVLQALITTCLLIFGYIGTTCWAAESQRYMLLQPTDFALSGGWVTQLEGSTTILRGATDNQGGSSVSCTFRVSEAGEYTIWVRSRDYTTKQGVRYFHVSVDDNRLQHVFGKHGVNGWAWERSETVQLSSGKHIMQVHDSSGYYVRLSAVLITNDPSFVPDDAAVKNLEVSGRLEKMAYAEPTWMMNLTSSGRKVAKTEAQEVTLENSTYQATLKPDASVVVTQKATGAKATFVPSFYLLYSEANPNLQYQQIAETRRGGTVALGYDAAAWHSNHNLFQASKWQAEVTALGATVAEQRIRWQFPNGIINAELSLMPDGSEPTLTFTLHAPTAGYYSVGYTGAPSWQADQTEWIWQPLIWQGKRFPLKPYLTEEARASIPAVLMGVAGNTVGVAADPQESPFRLPTPENSRFGVAIRNNVGMAQPIIFAPVFGGAGSLLVDNSSFTFALRLVVQKGAWYESYKHLAYNLFGFHDYRQNGISTLNQTLDNMVDFVLNDQYAYWYPEYKANGYQNDKPGYARHQSAVDALSLAMVRDSREIYDRRALPTIEYLVSRNSQYFNMKKFEPQSGMGGPVPDSLADLAALYLMSGRRSTVFRTLAEKVSPTLRFSVFPKYNYNREQALDNAKLYLRDLIAMYRMTKDVAYLEAAKKAADDYITWRLDIQPTDFYDVFSSFWSEIAPIWDALYELYIETQEQKYLNAAILGMEQFTSYVYLQPTVPAGDVTVNRGGEVRGMQVPEETVPAWRVSANGLTSEAAGTSSSHRGIFMTPYAAYMARLAHFGGDTFFTDIARSAILGRYANYPSYAYRVLHTTVFEKPDYPLRPFEELTYTTEHYNHPLPQTLFIIDYLVADTFARSKGAISFPARYTSTGAYFRNQVYGDRPGTFYGDNGVWLWLPKALLSTNNLQVNYLAGYGNGNLYIALTNQSDQPISATVNLNSSLVAYGATQRVRVWEDNSAMDPMQMHNGQITVSTKEKGITALVIEGVQAQTQLQRLYQADRVIPLPENSYQEANTPIGKVTGMVISLAKPLTSAYVWLGASPDVLKEATLYYATGTDWKQMKDTTYPFEFSVPLQGDAVQFTYRVAGVTKGNDTKETATYTLQLMP